MTTSSGTGASPRSRRRRTRRPAARPRGRPGASPPSAAEPVADRMSAATIAAANSASAAIVAIEATTGTTSSRARTATWRISTNGSADPSQVAANRPQPVSSPTIQPMPKAIGSQPMTARATRPRTPPSRSSVSARMMSSAARPRSGGGCAADARRRSSAHGPASAADGSASAGASAARSGGRSRRRVPPRACRVGRPGRRVRDRLADRPVGRSRARPGASAPTSSARRGAGRSGDPAVRRCGVGRADLGRPGPHRSPGPCLVLRSVLARVRVFLRVERPVRAARRPVPAGAAPVGLERPIGAVIRGRSERGLVALRPARPAGVRVRGRSPSGPEPSPRPGVGASVPASALASRLRPSRLPCGATRSGPAPVCRGPSAPALPAPSAVPPGRARAGRRRLQLGPAACARASRSVGPERRHRPSRRRRRTPRPPAIRPTRRVAPVRVGLPGSSRRAGGPTATRPGRRAGQELLVGRLDGEEPGQRRLAGRVGMVDLGQSAVGALDLVERRTRRQLEHAVRIGIESHRRRSVHSAVSGPAAAGSDQPMSSPTGASSNSGTVSAPRRPCGSRITGRW